MKIEPTYTDEPMKTGKIVQDFLPSPDQLVPKEEVIKVTLSLSKSSVVFFKNQAKKHHTKYQKMIRSVVDSYAERYTEI